MAGLIDKDAELARLTRETEKLTKEVARLSGKLGNPGFTAKAPAKVIELEQQKLNDAQSSLTELEAQRIRIAAL
jgi:valyl-tRNA synthetase